MKKAAFSGILIFLLFCFMVTSHRVFAYGGGGDGGGAGSAQTSGSSSSSGSWGVSWGENPNGADVFGSSIWAGRPENIHHGPYQPDKAVEDAEAELISGFQSGNYTPEQVREQLEWAQRVGIKISGQAQEILDRIKHPAPVSPPVAATNPSPSSGSSAADEKLANKLELYLNIWAAVNSKIKDDKANGRETSVNDIKGTAAVEILKDKVKQYFSDK